MFRLAHMLMMKTVSNKIREEDEKIMDLKTKLKDLNIKPLEDHVYENCKGCGCTIEATEFKPYFCPSCGGVISPCNVCNELDIRSIFMVDKCYKECPIMRECNKSPESVAMYASGFIEKEKLNKAMSKEYDRIQNLLDS